MLIRPTTETTHRILCVDDEVVATTLRGEIFREQGYSVILFHCPFKALESDLTAVDLAVLDFHMPGMNGRELLLRIRALGAPYPDHPTYWMLGNTLHRRPRTFLAMPRQGRAGPRLTGQHLEVFRSQ